MFDWFAKLFGGNNDDEEAYKQLPQATKDAAAYVAGVGAGIPGKPGTYATTAPIDNIVKKYIPTGPSLSGGSVAGASTNGGGAGRSGVAPVDTLAPQRGDVLNKINQINSLYGSIFGNIDRVAGSRTADVIKNYGQETEAATNAFGQNAVAQANAFGGRGLGDSSYYLDAQKSAKDTFDTNLDKLKTGRDSNLANIGQYVTSTKAGYDATKNQINENVPKIKSFGAADLIALMGQLDNIYRQATLDNTGLGVPADFISKLGTVTPLKQNVSDQLTSQLQKVVGSNTTQAAKDAIAKGLIANSGQDQNQWSDYYRKLVAGTA